jgi:hypothetical protein
MFVANHHFNGQVLQSDSPKWKECKLHSKRRNGRWRRKKIKENGDQMDELRCLSNYSDTSLESGQVNITQNQVNGEVSLGISRRFNN